MGKSMALQALAMGLQADRTAACPASLWQDEVVAYVRRRSSAFSRGKSRFRGVSGQSGRWEARIGSFKGRKNVGG